MLPHNSIAGELCGNRIITCCRGRFAPALLERAIAKGRITTWLDAQHQYADIVQRPQLRPAPLAVTAVATAMAATARPTPRRAAAGPAIAAAVEAVVAGPAAVQGRAGRERVRPCRTRLPKFSHSRQSAKPLRLEQRSNPTFVTSSCATRGTTGRGQPKSCTIYSWRLVSKFGSARRTLASACR